MKSLKKTLVLLVVLSMIFSTLVPAFAATDVAGDDCEDAVLRMEALGIIEGYKEDGTFRPENTITRAEMAVIICKMTGITDAAQKASANVDSKFSDVKAGAWYTGWVNLAAGTGIISGFPDGTFRPDEVLTLNQVLTLCVKALGRGGYVDQMGTWPANYVTEAARLNLLKDVKNADTANRGTVAIICWNTLRADTWYVKNETLDGDVNLSDSGKSLLEINFTEYTHEDSEEEGGLKEVEATVISTPARNTEIGERQIVVEFAKDYEDVDYGFKTKADYKKSQLENKTYTSEEAGGLVSYVPAEVYEDIDSLRNKAVTMIFGDDNEVALIVVDSDIVDNDFFTRYKDDEITVGGEKYELADTVEVIVNDVKELEVEGEKEALTLDAALRIILGLEENDEIPTKTFKKNIEAELTLNEDEDVKKIVMFVSGNYPEFNTTEAIVTKAAAKVLSTTAGKINWDPDKYEDKDYPRVYVDGVKAEITDIEAGNVLTIFGYDKEAENISVIYASTKTIDGTVDDVKNSFEIRMDGESYLPSAIASAIRLEGELDKSEDRKEENKDFNDLDGEENVVLYMNVLGEYVMVDADTVDSDWQFAVVKRIFDAEEDEEDEDIYTQPLNLSMMDGNTARKTFKLLYDHTEKDEYVKDKIDYTHPDDLEDNQAIVDIAKGDLVAFKANADGEIELGDIFVVDTEDVSKNTEIEGYEFILVPEKLEEGDSINFDNKRFDLGGVRYKVTAKTTLYDMGETEVIKWKELVDEKEELVGAPTLLIMEEDSTEIAHVIAIETPNDVHSDVEFALVVEGPHTSSKTKTVVTLLGVDGETYEYECEPDEDLVEGRLIAYTVSGDKLELADVNINVDLVAATEAEDDETIEIGEKSEDKGAYLVETVDSDYFTYTDEDENGFDPMAKADRIVDVNTDDVIVVEYELDDEEIGTFVEAEFDEDTLKDNYVLAFNMDNDTADVELLVVIK